MNKKRVQGLVLVVSILALPLNVMAPGPVADRIQEQPTVDRRPDEKPREQKGGGGFFSRLFGSKKDSEPTNGSRTGTASGSDQRVPRQEGQPGGSSVTTVQDTGPSDRLDAADAQAIEAVARESRRSSEQNRGEKKRPQDLTLGTLSPVQRSVLKNCLSNFESFNGEQDLLALKKAYENSFEGKSDVVQAQLREQIKAMDALLENPKALASFTRVTEQVATILRAEKITPVEKRMLTEIPTFPDAHSLHADIGAVRMVESDLVEKIVNNKVARRENTRHTGVHDDEQDALRFFEDAYQYRMSNKSLSESDRTYAAKQLGIVRRLQADPKTLNSLLDQNKSEMDRQYNQQMALKYRYDR